MAESDTAVLERALLAREVGQTLLEGTESWEPFGPAIGYLLLAILNDTQVELASDVPEDLAFLTCLKQCFPADQRHAIWRFVRTTE